MQVLFIYLLLITLKQLSISQEVRSFFSRAIRKFSKLYVHNVHSDFDIEK